MSSKPHGDPIYTPTKNIKFAVSLNEEQKIAKSVILSNTITHISGRAGSGKTMLAVQCALDGLFKKEYKRLVITRPLVTAEEEIGFLPGGIKEKTDPYLRPIYDMIENLHRGTDEKKIEKMIADKTIEIVPFGFMRGMNLNDAFVIADEAQNCTASQLKLIMTRLTKSSKLVICGDIDQVDLKKKSESGFFMLNKITDVEGFAKVELFENHRHPIVERILTKLEQPC